MAAPSLYLPGWRALLPVDVVSGKVSAADDITRRIGAAAALEAATTLLPPDTRVGYFGLEREGAQSYTEARLAYFGADPLKMPPDGILMDLDLLGTTPEAVLLASLQKRPDIDYFIWNRLEAAPRIGTPPCSPPPSCASTPAFWPVTAVAICSSFCRRVVPAGASRTGPAGRSRLESVGGDSPWTTVGHVRAPRDCSADGTAAWCNGCP